MTADVGMLVYSTLLTWVMVMVAAVLKTRLWRPSGLKVALGNRDEVLDPAPVAARADRAARNMLENMVLFVAVLVAARLADAPPDRIASGAQLFFSARVAYFLLYLAGVTHLRTLAWSVSVVAMGLVGLAALTAPGG